jgi:hypothetical protein
MKICIEMSQLLNENYHFTIFSLMVTETLVWNFMRLRINDSCQKVCKYLSAINNVKNTKSLDQYDIRKLLEHKVMDIAIC